MTQRPLFQESHNIFRHTVQRFIEAEILPHRVEWEKAGTVPREVWKKAGAAGLLCCDLPEKYGGAGADFIFNMVVNEELTAAGGSGPALTVQSDIVAPYLMQFGTEEQKQKYLPGMASGEIITAIAMTEPSAGSDLKAIRTTALRDGDDYVINGQKVFISNGHQAHLIILAAKTDPAAGGKGISLILVDTETPGFSRGKMLEKIGRKAQDTSELFFDDLRVPVSNLLGVEGAGFSQLITLLAQERLSSAIRAVAIAERALTLTIEYVNQREAFGRKLAEFQNTQFTLADLWSQMRVHQVFVDDCVARLVCGDLSPLEAATAKLRASEMEGHVVDQCVQLFGGWGYMWEMPIARLYADARVDRISAGSNPILKMIIGRDLLKAGRKPSLRSGPS